MALFGKKNKKTSSSVAGDRLKLILTYDRAGTTSNAELMKILKKAILDVISEYIEIDEDEFVLDITTAQSNEDMITSELTANIPIKRVKKLPKNM